MNVADLYEKLSYGPMSGLFCGVDGQGEIEENRKPALISHANDALVRLYTQFILLEKDLVLQMVQGITNYHLIPKFATTSTSREPVKYILDLPQEPFLGDIVKIHEVWSSEGHRVPLNDNEAAWSVFSPQAGVLQVPRPMPYEALGIHYQAKHPKLQWDDDDQEIQLPLVLEEAMIAYIGFKAYSNIRTEEAMASAQEQMALYNAVVQEVKDNDLVSSTISQTNQRFAKRGWV